MKTATKTKPATVETYLPVFPGFYNTLFELNHESEDERQELEHLFTETFKLPEYLIERFVQLVHCEDSLYKIDYSQWEYDAVKALTEEISFQLSEIETLKGFDCLEFQKICSPKEYNFSNDSGNISVKLTDERLFRASLLRYIRANRAAFDSHIKSRYTSRDGFISHYSNDGKDWIEDIQKGCSELDGHKLGRILDFILETEGYGEESLYDAFCEETCNGLTISKYISGPLFNLERLPGPVLDILEIIDKGQNQLLAYRESGVSQDSIDRQRAGLHKAESKLLETVKEILIDTL